MDRRPSRAPSLWPPLSASTRSVGARHWQALEASLDDQIGLDQPTMMVLVALLAAPVHAGELDLDLGLQATATGWDDDYGGGPSLDAGWWFTSWLGASFIGKEHYATVDDRFMTYLSINAAARQQLGPVRVIGTVGVVHQHEESTAAIMDQPLQSVFGVGDGIRHRMASRAGFSLGLPLSTHANGDYYLALDIDGTVFADADRGPRWMSSAGLSLGFTYDFARR